MVLHRAIFAAVLFASAPCLAEDFNDYPPNKDRSVGDNTDHRYAFPDSSENQIMPSGRQGEEYGGVGPNVVREPSGSICVGAAC